ncbi:protein mini spindles [Leptidea sinapis]|nr:protein mini spindles [Leptidea sinapis]
MDDENEYKKLPTEEKCVHKLWKARVAGYEEAMKVFNQIDDEKSPEWNKYLGLIKKFVTDSNAVAQEKGLEAALVFVENCGHAGKTTGEVMSGIVSKCIAAPKTKTKDLALQITLMYVEIEKHEIVEEELLKGMEQKNPKVVAACVVALNTALKQFGNKVITIKPMVKKISVLLADRDKTVRDEMKALVVEMHRWIGPAIEPHIASLQAVVQQELREAFAGIGGSAHPTRYLRSQQHRVRDTPVSDAVDGDGEDDDAEAGGGDSGELDPYDMMDPVEILSKLPKDFYENLESKKWQVRKQSLDALENILKTAVKLEPGDYADLIRALKKVITKDANVILVALSVKLMGQVARGLRNKFQPYAVSCIQALLEKFKEKKPTVVTALREAIDAIYPCTNPEAIMEDMIAAFENKNPSIKAESASFLARALCVTQPAAFNKKLIKAYVPSLLKLLESADPAVRDAASEALGTATKLVGEKNIAPHIGKLDNLKEQKIKEFADKAEIKVKISAPKKEVKPKGAATGKGDSKPSAGSTAPKPVKRPQAKKVVGSAKKAPKSAQASPPREQELSSEEVDARAEGLFPEDVVKGLTDGNWKTRLQSVQSFHSTIQGLTMEDTSAQVLYRVLNKKPGLKDTNVQVLKARLEACKYITENFPISTTAASFVLQDVVTKLGEASCAAVSADCLSSIAEGCGLEYVVNEGLAFAMDVQKNPKVQSEMFNWTATAIREFGFSMSVKSIVAHSKKALAATNPNVRGSTVTFLGVLSLYVGPSLISHFDGEKAATKQLISSEIDKHANSSPPTPSRQMGRVTKSASKASVVDEISEGGEDLPDEEPEREQEREKQRTDLAPLITDTLVGELNDKNWKVRNEALDKLKAIITNSSPIKSSLGELPQSLVARLIDSNTKLAQSALQICEMLAAAMGPKCKHHVRTFFPAFFQAFGDNKQWIRSAAISCVDAWCREAGAGAAFDGEMIHDALKTGSPVLRAALFQWLADKLPDVAARSFPREELAVCVPLLFACLEERGADVRRAANECVLPFMLHLTYEAMHKQLDKLKPGSKTVVLAALDKARPNLPVTPLPTKAKKEEPRAKSAGAQKKEPEKKAAPAKPKGLVKPMSAGRGKKEDEDLTPLLPNNTAKNQRIVDDQKLKVLKWNFTTPREEFFELLKDQMNSAGLNKQLMANMFHSDFRYHLKAIESLSEDLHDNGPALAANLDLVLKWLTLRFFDTNPSVILKGLEYLSQVFQYLIESDYTMAEYEANCFIPYLVLKVGDPKDTVRNGVKALFKQIGVVYSVTKLCGYLMEGLKSKNARQRAECLDCINHLMETHGSAVMAGGGVSSGAALKELARHIGDRDNAVRSAALNCLASAYFLDGEKIYRSIGQLSDKDLSLLEERIKRAGKTRSAEARRAMVVPLSATGRPVYQLPVEEPERVITVDTTPGEEYEDEEPDEQPPVPIPVDHQPTAASPESKVVRGPFGLDPELIAQLDAAAPVRRAPEISKLDIEFLEEPVKTPRATKTNPCPSVVQSPPRGMPAAPGPAPAPPGPAPLGDSQLADTIHTIASPDLNAAIRALHQISVAIQSGRSAALASHEALLVSAVSTQFRRLRTSPTNPQTFAAYKYLVGVLNTLYETAGCGYQVGEAALVALLSELLLVLVSTADGGDDRLVRVLNNVCVRVLENSPRTALLCALVSLLHDSIADTNPQYPRFQDLLLKCFWKTLKMITSWEVNSIDYDSVLYKIHLFYKAYPNSYWKKNTDMSDTPYRTVKTLVHTLVKSKGSSITNHLTQIPDINESDLYPYLHKVLKQLKLDDKKEVDTGNTLAVNVSPNKALSAGRLPRHVHEELAHILKRIGSQEHKKEALSQLYDLRERHPDVDIWTYMTNSSFYFRNFVERGLSEVAEQRTQHTRSIYKPNMKTQHIDMDNETDENNTHLVFLEKLRALQAKAGLKIESSTSPSSHTPTADNRTLADSNDNALPRPHSIDPQLEVHTSPNASRNGDDVYALRMKLQKLKTLSSNLRTTDS